VCVCVCVCVCVYVCVCVCVCVWHQSAARWVCVRLQVEHGEPFLAPIPDDNLDASIVVEIANRERRNVALLESSAYSVRE
jgi:hypothetical protein